MKGSKEQAVEVEGGGVATGLPRTREFAWRNGFPYKRQLPSTAL